MYSYKGGSGRSVATANVAKHLVAEGKSVLVIDLDTESSGLSYIFNIPTKTRNMAIQDVLLDSYTDASSGEIIKGIKSNLLNVEYFDDTWPRMHFDIEDNPNFCFIHARYGYRDAVSTVNADKLHVFIKRLNKNMDEVYNRPFDFVIIDSPSGYQNWAVKLFTETTLVVFFRWSRQFTEGTIKFLTDRLLPTSSGLLELPKNTVIVPSAVPFLDDEANGEMHGKKKEYINSIMSNIEFIKGILKRDFRENHNIIFDEEGIPECTRLKWDEQILMNRNDLSQAEMNTVAGYKRLADTILSLKKGE